MKEQTLFLFYCSLEKFHEMIRRALGLRYAFVKSFSSISSSKDLNVIELWDSVLAGVHAPQDHSFKDLLATGILLNKGRSQNLFPDEIISSFRSFYSTLDLENKHRLFHSLATVFGLDKAQIDQAVEHWNAVKSRTSPDPAASTASTSAGSVSEEAFLRAAERLYQSTQPSYNRLWPPLAQQTDGLSFLVDLRGDLLECISAHPAGAGSLRLMSEGLRRTLAGWFNVGLLQLERVTWENSSGLMLEKISQEERVHSISSISVLKKRLGDNRRVFSFVHPSLPGEPLVALHVALCSSVVSSMDEILLKENSKNASNRGEEKEADGSAPTVAIFYSISNMKRGLTGVDLGNNLIKRAAKELLIELPSLQTLATLSPLSSFKAWVERLTLRVDQGGGKLTNLNLLSPEEKENLIAALQQKDNNFKTTPLLPLIDITIESTPSHILLRHALSCFTTPTTAAASGSSSAAMEVDSSILENALKAPLLRLAAYYLLNEKHRGRALDSVANFHLRNGAKIHRLNWKADTSQAGMERSYGIMVNYMYDMDSVEENNRKYIVEGEIAVSREVEKLFH
jgi:hypothetical protein